MKHPLVGTARCLTGMALVLLGLSTYGCGDSATENPEASLANLTVTTGADTVTLNPQFNPAATNYTVDLSNNITTVTITAQPAVAGDSVSIDGQATTNSAIDLGPSVPTESTKVVSVVVSNPPSSSRTYTVLLKRAGLAGNNSLATLLVSPGTLAPDFNANTLSYTVDVANNVTSLTVTPTLSDPGATMAVNGQPTISGQARTITLGPAGQPTNIPVVVTAQNGNVKNYLVTVSRGVSSNNNLQSLTVSPGTLNPSFNVNRTSYTVNVASTVTSVTVTPRQQDPAATIIVQPANPVQLGAPGSNTPLIITVTAQNGTQKTYTVGIVRAALGGNNNLSALAVTPSPLDSPFNANDLSYTVNVGSSVGSVTVRPTLADPAATLTVNGQPTNSGQTRTVALNGPGQPSIIPIVVTAQNGSQKPYTVTVQRAALGGNNNLSALSVSPGTLNPVFNANTVSYTAEVGSNVTSVTVTPRMQDSAATMTVNGQPTPSGQARSISLNGAGSNTLINILVAAQNGSQKNYTVNVSRAALGGNNNLSGLSVSPGTLNPTFRADRIAYTVNVGSAVASLNVTATVQDAGASLTMNGQGASSGQPRSIPLGPPGTTTEINVVVNAPNGNPRTYQIDVIREALGGNNNLQNLSVSPGSLTPAFTPETLTYSVDVSNDTSSISVAATKADPSAVISGDLPNNGQATIQLDGGPSTRAISIIVTAPNQTSKNYIVTVNRAAPSAPSAPANAPDLIPADDSGFLPGQDSDNITNVTTPRFQIQPRTGETPSLYVDGNKVSASFNQGANTLQPTSPLSDGVHSVTYTMTNSSTLESAQSPALSVTIDTVGPVTP